jgi:alanyl-tRNA synthetase
MTERLYYQNSFLFNFTAAVESVTELPDGRRALLLDRTAFYPTSGGQPFDTGWIEFVSAESEEPLPLPKLRVSEVIEDEVSGNVLHILVNLPAKLPLSFRVRGFIDAERRQDHMQQHSGQHVLSAAFLRVFDLPTLSFHLGEELCAIDLDAAKLSAEQLEQAEQVANQFVWEDRQVLMHEVTAEQARKIGVRKIPERVRGASHETLQETLRLIEIRGVDVCACGGTHVRATGQIGNIQVRGMERVRQGLRVGFVCGKRALLRARRDFQLLSDAAALCSSHPDEVPAQTRRLIESDKTAHHRHRRLMAELADVAAQQKLARTPDEHGRKIVAEFLAGRDLEFVKLYAQKLVATEPNVIALLGTEQPTPTLVFAHSAGAAFDGGAELRALVASVGGRGGGTRDMAQGGVPSAEMIPRLIAEAAQRARALCPSTPAASTPGTPPTPGAPSS